jgi:Holliday junction resolvase RusA-like endonuclease
MKVTLYIKPCAKARPRMTKSGHAYMPKAYMDWRARFRQLWHNCVPKFPPFSENIAVTVFFYTTTGTMRPDLDNAAAAVLDALQDVNAITNDRHVFNIVCSIIKDPTPRIEITLT